MVALAALAGDPGPAPFVLAAIGPAIVTGLLLAAPVVLSTAAVSAWR